MNSLRFNTVSVLRSDQGAQEVFGKQRLAKECRAAIYPPRDLIWIANWSTP